METFLLLGFFMSAYSVVANDSIQTLGTFISSNKNKSWYQLWIWFGGIMIATATIGWFLNGGDLSWGRLSTIPYPDKFKYKFLLAPICLLILTRIGVPVSTTLFTLTTFASTPTVMKMCLQSHSSSGRRHSLWFVRALGLKIPKIWLEKKLGWEMPVQK